MRYQLKIVFIITGLNQGGAEAMLFKLLNGLNKRKFECLVVSMSDMGVYGGKITALGIPVFCLKMNSARFSFIGFCSFLKIIYNYKPDIIQGWMYHGNLFAIFLKLTAPKTKVIFNIRCSLKKFSQQRFFSFCVVKLNALFSNRAVKVINNSRISIEQHEKIKFSKKNSIYISNGFDVNLFRPNLEIYKNFRLKHMLDSNTRVIGSISRFHPMKNHLGLLAVFHKIKTISFGKTVLVLGGLDIDFNNQVLVRFAQELGVNHECIFLGSVKSYEIMPAFDVYLSSSSYGEGFPNVIGEAMLCGVPCVATDVGDCKQIMGGLGAVAAPGDYDLLAKHCLEKLDISNEMRGRIRQHVIDHYSIEKIVDQYQDLYADILKEKI